MTPNPVSTRLPALHDTLNCATTAVLAAMCGEPGSARANLLEAGIAASETFPAGSPEAAALNMILGTVQDAVAASEVAQ
jgi:hypothetical protein